MKLSIITINRNNAAGLRKTIESVVSQTYTDFEYIIIDGASTDGSVEVIKEYAKATLPNGEALGERLYWISEPDKGIYNAMNKGILKANGEYLLFLNSGDWLYNENIFRNVFDQHRSEDILYGCDMLYYRNDKVVFKAYPPQLTFLFMISGTISHQGTFLKRNLFENSLYNEQYKIVADYDFYIKNIVIKNCSTFYLDFPIVYFDMYGISMSKDNETLLWNERKTVLNSYFPELVLNDMLEYNKLHSITNYSLYPYVEIFAKHPRLQRIVRRFMKLLLFTVRKKNS